MNKWKIHASKHEFDNPSEAVRFQIVKQLSNMDVAVYHIDSLYRDNANDKYCLAKNICKNINE
jgi:hypothetical protein